jgi:hypothetical protein
MVAVVLDIFPNSAGLKRQGAGFAACPLKNPLYHILHSVNSSSRPGSEAFLAALIGLLRIKDKWVQAAIGQGEQKLFSCSRQAPD